MQPVRSAVLTLRIILGLSLACLTMGVASSVTASCPPAVAPGFARPGKLLGWNQYTPRPMAVMEQEGVATLFLSGRWLAPNESLDVARWNPTTREWLPLPGIFHGPGGDYGVLALAVADLGDGPSLYAAGEFETVDGQWKPDIVRWDERLQSWIALGSGLTDGPTCTCAYISSMVVHDDGSGPALYVAGQFSAVDGLPALHIARWDGSSWSDVGGGVDRPVNGLASFDAGDGSGPCLYACGGFKLAGSTPVTGLARWTGTTWQPVGPPLTENIPSEPSVGVSSMVAHDDGTGDGTCLFVQGPISAGGGVPLPRIGKWVPGRTPAPGAGTWKPVGTLEIYRFDEMVVAPDPDSASGTTLYARGDVDLPGFGEEAVLRWDGSSWLALGGGTTDGSQIVDLQVHDFGDGPRLVASGGFGLTDKIDSPNVAIFDGNG